MLEAVESTSAPPEGVPPNTAHAAAQTAKWVVQHGQTFEGTIRSRNKGNELFSFLFEDETSPAAAFYAARLEAERAASARVNACFEGSGGAAETPTAVKAEVSQAQHSLVALITAANADIADRIGQATEDIESKSVAAAAERESDSTAAATAAAAAATSAVAGTPVVFAGAEHQQKDSKAWAVRKELEMQETILQ